MSNVVEKNDEKTMSSRRWACLVHLSAAAGLFYPFLPLVGPLLIWLFKRQRDSYVDEQGRLAVNFHLSMCIYLVVSYVVVAVLKLVIVGFILFWLPGLIRFAQVLLGLVGALRAYDVEHFNYPLSIEFIKPPKPGIEE